MPTKAVPTALGFLLVMVIAMGAPAASPSAPDQTLTRGEKATCDRRRGDCKVIQRENVILVWPQAWKPSWYAESKISTPEDVADFLELAYRLMARWTDFDPNKHYAERNHERIRLIFIFNGDSDFVFGGARPFIGLRDGKSPVLGTEDWLGWVTHEMSHDFWHEHPVFQRVKEPWGEAMCDYSRYYLLLNCGMPAAAMRWRGSLESAAADDRYRGGANILLKCDHAQKLDGPAGLWFFLRDKSFESSWIESSSVRAYPSR
jgi:hypothetical protein